jgi:polysaccharide chain length determinant protein (PEP-CTERM system associated)
MDNASPSFHPLDYVSVLRRRMWWFIAPVALAVVAAAALVTWLPREYKTAATIGVSLPSMSPELLNQSGKIAPEDRIRNITQTIFSPTVLERVAREEGFEQHMKLNEAVALVRSRVEVALMKPEPGQPVGFDQFLVAYRDSTPEMAQRVANRVADVFIQESSRKREIRAEETSAFIGKQLASSQQRLSVLEGQLREAKEAFMGALPEQTHANVAMVTGLQQQLETTRNAIRGEQDRLSMIERQVGAMKAGAANETSVPGTIPAVASPAAVRVVQLERELEVARGNYTEKHPEIVRLRDELAAARAAVQADQARPETERLASLRVDPSYRALLSDAQQARLRITQLQRQEAQIGAQIAMYRARVDSAPRVEQQIATLQREYDLEKQQYGQLTGRLRTAEIAENLERSRGSEQFTVLARAGFPTEPDNPKPIRLWTIVLLLGFVIGGGLALGREYLDRSIHDARALSDLDLPVLGEIPRIANA